MQVSRRPAVLARRVDLDEPVAPHVIRSLRERIELLEEENRQLREAAEPLVLFPPAWRLAEMEAKFLSALMRSRTGYMSKEALLTALYGLEPDVQDKIVDVWLCKVRKKLAAAGIAVEIQTIWGQGYGLAAGARAILRAALDAGDGGDEAARLRELHASVTLLTERAAEREATILALRRQLEELQTEDGRRQAAAIPAPAPAVPKAKAWKRWAAPKRHPGVAGLRGGRRHGR